MCCSLLTICSTHTPSQDFLTFLHVEYLHNYFRSWISSLYCTFTFVQPCSFWPAHGTDFPAFTNVLQASSLWLCPWIITHPLPRPLNSFLPTDRLFFQRGMQVFQNVLYYRPLRSELLVDSNVQLGSANMDKASQCLDLYKMQILEHFFVEINAPYSVFWCELILLTDFWPGRKKNKLKNRNFPFLFFFQNRPFCVRRIRKTTN